MHEYEYQVAYHSARDRSLDDLLNARAQHGWETVSAMYRGKERDNIVGPDFDAYQIVFRRPIGSR